MKTVTISDILTLVSKEVCVPITDIKKPSRSGDIILARQLSMWACRWNTKQPMMLIAAEHGKKQHGTVINACKSIENQALSNPRVRRLCENIRTQIKIDI